MTTSRLLGIAFLWLAVILPVRAETHNGLRLAAALAEDGHHAEAALEYRRLAMHAGTPESRGALYWMAAYEYIEAQRFPQAARMLSEVENVAPDRETETYLLHAKLNRARNSLREAAFYLESIAQPETAAAVRSVAAIELASIRLQMRDFAGARDAVRLAEPSSPDASLNIITAYESRREKSHVVGGLLGLVPGLGYAYSGEYGNAVRSLLLNALCIWGLTEFVEEEQWGGVALVGFAEATFYSGSIYGGVDAAVRHNRRRLDDAIKAIEGEAGFRPDRATLPVLTLRYDF